MPDNKLRKQIVHEAARLMYSRQESEYYRAKMKAARKICRGWVKPSALPSNREIRAEVQRFDFLYEGDDRVTRLRNMRLEALRLMRILRDFKPRLIGSTLTGHVRQGSDIDLHLFPNSLDAVLGAIEWEGMEYDVEQKRIRKNGEERLFTHVHIREQFPVELTIYSADQSHYVFKSSITGKAIERASIKQLEKFLAEAYPHEALDDETLLANSEINRFQLFRVLMLPLAHVKQDRNYHPEGDALYHSLQVFDLASDELPYDEEFLLAALLHDVGKGIDRHNHVESGIEALGNSITERTRWLIQHHMDAHKMRDGTIGVRARRRLSKSDDYETLQLLQQCDACGRVPGVDVPDLEDALDCIRDLSRMYG